MKVAIFSAKPYEIPFFLETKTHHDLIFISDALDAKTIDQVQGAQAVACLVSDDLTASILTKLKDMGVQLIALRSAGYDHIDLKTAHSLGLAVARVPAYSPEAIAEFSLGLLLDLLRKISRGHDRVRQHNFSLVGQLGKNLHDRTVGVIGAGLIGTVFVKLLRAFDCKVLISDPIPSQSCKALGANYVPLEILLRQSEIISLNCPLNDSTRHIINLETIEQMQDGVTLINTGRGGLIDTTALIEGLKQGKIGAVGLDVYEDEHKLFFKDRSEEIIDDDRFILLQAFPNVIITAHQAFLSQEAIRNIARISLDNINAFEEGKPQNQV